MCIILNAALERKTVRFISTPPCRRIVPSMDRRLLLVLDLNGTPVLCSRRGSTVFHRPYPRTFLRYLSVASSEPKSYAAFRPQK